MAKTPLFSRLRCLTARALGNSPRVSRRALLGYGFGSALAACGPTSTPPPSTPLDNRRVAVIGAGLGGLHCAYRLFQAGVDVRVYEANTRIGGRIFTGRRLFADERAYCELGGEFIEDTHATMLQLSSEFAIPLEDRQATFDGLADSFWANGAEVPADKLLLQLSSAAPVMLGALSSAETDPQSARLLDNTTLASFLASSVPQNKFPELLLLMNAAFRAEFGLEPDVQSALNAWRLFPAGAAPNGIYGGAEHRYRAIAGNDGFARSLAQPLAERVQLDRRLVAAVPLSDGSFRLTFEDVTRTSFEAESDHVVFALPFSTLRQIRLDALPLSDAKRRVISQLSYGSGSKLVGAFSGKPWRDRFRKSGSATSDLPSQTVWESSRGPSLAAGLLTNLLAGDAGELADRVGVDDAVRTVLADIDEVWGVVSDAYVDGSALRMHWPSSPYAAGSASVYRAGQRSSFEGSEGTREGKLHFCGEHCSIDFKGTLEGAAETGALVAAEILKDFGLALPKELEPLVKMKALVGQPALSGPSAGDLGVGARQAQVLQSHAEFVARLGVRGRG
ncbi:MAG: NAD(P)/FAD-dependent oxidoreductase [Polyangiaceae bacterium]